VTKSQILPRGIEKVLAVHADLAGDEDTLGRLIRGLDAAARWCDERQHHAELAELLARPEYVNLPAGLIERSLAGRLELASGAALEDPDFLHFHRHDANLPRRMEAVWLYAQMARWGQLRAAPELQMRAAQVFRDDLYRRALRLPESRNAAMAPPFDGIQLDDDSDEQLGAPYTGAAVDPTGDAGVRRDRVARYLERFAVRTPFVESPFALQS
jgi:hypothetical protein